MIEEYFDERPSATQMPYNAEAEQSLIGSLLKKPDLLDQLPADLCSTDFTARHARMFAAISTLVFAGKSVDVITVAEELSKSGEDELDYLTDLTTSGLGGYNVAAYAEIITDCATQRKMHAVGVRISRLAFDDGVSDSDAKVQAANELVGSLERTGGDEPRDINELLKTAIDQIELRFQGKAPIGLKTGFSDLDDMLRIAPTNLVILAARPSMGKTALALNIANSVVDSGSRVLVFSIESSSDEIADRMIASSAGIDLGRIKTGSLSEDDWPRLELGVRKLKDAKLKVEDSSVMSISRLQAIARKENRKEKLGLVVVDYLQLMNAKAENKRLEVGAISRGLKALAKQIDCPVIALSQLSRDVEKRNNKRPINSDLRESGEIEQDADAIVFIYRDDYYVEKSNEPGIAELIITKQRDGKTGTVRLANQLQYCRFANLDPGYRPPEPEKPLKSFY